MTAREQLEAALQKRFADGTRQLSHRIDVPDANLGRIVRSRREAVGALADGRRADCRAWLGLAAAAVLWFWR
jgi:hypothetical protein